MNEAFKTVAIFMCGFAFGCFSCLLFKWYGKRNSNNSDNNIQQAVAVLGDARTGLADVSTRIENSGTTAQSLADELRKYGKTDAGGNKKD